VDFAASSVSPTSFTDLSDPRWYKTWLSGTCALPKIPFSSFHQCNIVTLRPKLAHNINSPRTGKPFLTALKAASTELHGMFTEPDIVTFIERIASLRHLSAHRGQIAPGPVYESPDHEPTIEELDAEITAKGLDAQLQFFPAGAVRDAFRDNIRYTLRLSKYKLVLEDMVIVDGKTVKGLINPLADTEYNFSKFLAFLDKVLNVCTKEIDASTASAMP
jgi:hypothetical protein